MNHPRPKADTIEYNGKVYSFKCYLKGNAFSYRCRNNYTHDCSFLLTIPIENNFDLETGKFTALEHARQASNKAHSKACNNSYNQTKKPNSESIESHIQMDKSQETFQEWNSDTDVLREYLRQNMSLIPSTIQANMKKIKQEFSISLIKKVKKELWEEIFPREPRIAFHPSNCKTTNAKDNYIDNLYRFYGKILGEGKCKDPRKEKGVEEHEYYIFASNSMLTQLSRSKVVYRRNF